MKKIFYCAFYKHATSKVQKPLSQLHLSLPSIIILITNNESLNTETHKTDRNPLITDNKPWPSSVTFYFLEGPLKGLTAAKKHERQLAFEFQRLGVFEKCSKWKQTNSTYFRIENWITFTKTKTSVLFVSNNSVIITCQNSWGNNKPINILTGEQEFLEIIIIIIIII